MNSRPMPTLFIPALLCDAELYRDVIGTLGSSVEAQVMISPKPCLEDSVADILARAPARFALVGTSYGGSLALEVALAASDRVTALWLMGCDPGDPQTGGPDLAGGLDTAPAAVIDILADLVVHKDATSARDAFVAMARRVGGSAGAAQARALSARSAVTPQLRNVTMPALLLWGEEDALVPVSVGQAMADALPHAYLRKLAGCGHLPTLEKPSEAATLFMEFLQGEAADAG